ncbi:hypothetical protein ACOMHN_002696 [Nucella lapillus]
MPRVTVVMPKVKKVQKFHGNQDDKGYGVEEFIDEVCLASADEGNPVQFVLEHLEGTAKREVRTCGLPVSSTKKIFSILREAFGDKRTLSEVTRSFMEQVQDPYEGVREYASNIFDQFIGLQKKQKDMCRIVSTTEVLCDQFVDGLRDKGLVWELKGQRRDEEVSFSDLRRRAMEWEQVQGTRGYSRRTPKAEVKEVGLDRQEKAIQELRSQVQALQDLMKDVAGKWLSAEGKGTQKVQALPSNSLRNRNVEWTEDGKPVCFFCKEAGHMQRRCPKRQTSQNRWNKKSLNGNPSV